MRIEFSATARRQVATLPSKVYDALAAAIDGPITDNPYQSSKPLHDELSGVRSVRRGDYRILIRITADVVEVMRIDHRSTVYRPR